MNLKAIRLIKPRILNDLQHVISFDMTMIIIEIRSKKNYNIIINIRYATTGRLTST